MKRRRVVSGTEDFFCFFAENVGRSRTRKSRRALRAIVEIAHRLQRYLSIFLRLKHVVAGHYSISGEPRGTDTGLLWKLLFVARVKTRRFRRKERKQFQEPKLGEI